jgi:hypothetical protein
LSFSASSGVLCVGTTENANTTSVENDVATERSCVAAAARVSIRVVAYAGGDQAGERRTATEFMGYPPDISESVRREVEKALWYDVRRLHTYIRGEFDGWGIA